MQVTKNNYEIEYTLIWMSWTCMKKSKQFSFTSSFNKEKRIIMSYHQISFEYLKPVSSSLSLSRFWKCNCSQHNNTTCLDRYLLLRNKIWIRPVIVIIIASILHFTKKIFQNSKVISLFFLFKRALCAPPSKT